MKVFKLLVQPTDICIELLKYVDDNIHTINEMGALIKIEKVKKQNLDEETLSMFRRNGITRLPALIAPDGKVFIGIKQVRNLFEKNLNLNNTREMVEPVNNVDDFWMRELFEGRDGNGKLIPRDDPDEVEDTLKDINRRLDEYRRNTPRHRRAESGRRTDVDRRDGNINDEVATERRRDNNVEEVIDSVGKEMGDEMDRRMLAAFLNNNPSSD